MRHELLTPRDDFFVVHDFLTAAECERFIGMSESAGFADAPISTLGGPVVHKAMRNNDRVMLDDDALAVELWLRLKPFVGPHGSWQPAGLNERFRFYRYDPGQRFYWHFDGTYERSPLARSGLTFMIYLNGGCTGGATEFDFRDSAEGPGSDLLRVTPEAGKALVFPHAVLHQGAEVTSGRKYVMRSDVMFRHVG